MTELGWEKKFSQASSLLRERTITLIEAGLSDSNEKLVEWMENTTIDAMEISPVCDGGHLALELARRMKHSNNGNKLQELAQHIIEKTDVHVPKVRSNDPSFDAAVAISSYLGSKGLINKI